VVGGILHDRGGSLEGAGRATDILGQCRILNVHELEVAADAPYSLVDSGVFSRGSVIERPCYCLKLWHIVRKGTQV